MKLHGFNNGNKQKQFYITNNDKEWVEENFKWLLKVYGYPGRTSGHFLANETFFPETLKNKNINIDSVLFDLTNLLHLDKQRISLELIEDIRDSYGVPYEFQGRPFECELEIVKSERNNTYKLFVANSLIRHPNRLLFCLIYEMIKIRLTESNLEFDTGEDTSFFFYLAGIFLGFGIILSQNLVDSGRQTDGFWETKWNYVSEMPIPVMAYALALYSNFLDQDNPEWKSLLPSPVRNEFIKALEFIKSSPNKVFEKELKVAELFGEAQEQYQKNDFDRAIATSQKILFLIQDEHAKSGVYNSMGYYYLRKCEYQKSIPLFQKALEINPSYGYANDNLGFAFIMSGDLDSGKYYLEIARQTENNDMGFTYRNLALYYQKRNEMNLAEDNFRNAFDSTGLSVDLLEYFYAKFLFEKGEKEEGFKYLQFAVDKGEPEAIELMNEMKNSL